MTVSMKVMSAGDGYKYLLKSVVTGDGSRNLSTPMTRYYTEVGTPPGRWIGSGLHALGDGHIAAGDPVSEEQLALLLGLGRDPVNGDQLGRPYRQFTSSTKRIADRVADLSPSLTDTQREEAVSAITAEEHEIEQRRAVAGFDFTFSVPKSLSVLWGVSDAGTQALIVEAHHEAVRETLDLIEREVAATRTGSSNGSGAVAQVDVVGLIAAAFDHWDSRLGDPQLHTHVVVSNKVKTAGDGRWRSLDSRALHAATVAISEHYNAVLADRITRTFGLEWEARGRGKDRNPSWELSAVSDRLVREFSGRARMIEVEKDRLVGEYEEAHGRRPTRTTVIRLRAQATLSTRPIKQIRSLADLTRGWRTRAERTLGQSPSEWTRQITKTVRRSPGLRADDVDVELLTTLGRSVVDVVSQKRSTWAHWNLWAEASRQTMGWRFATAEDRETVLARVVNAAEASSLAITPPEFTSSPTPFRRADGTSRFRPQHSTVFTSTELLAAEDRLLSRAESRTAPTVSAEVVAHTCRGKHHGNLLSDEQAAALTRIATSGRRVDLLIGPAGAGKTTAMHALRRAWQAEHGRASVVGLAPSAAAAKVLADDLDIECENTAKWLHENTRDRAEFRAGQLVIIDEATLAGTLSLDRLTGLAEAAGAKVLLVGDWAQLQSVDAGGAFNLLAKRRDNPPELTEVHRFSHAWEKIASLELRRGHAPAIATYIRHGRVHEGSTAGMLEAAYAAWRRDIAAGRSSVLVTDANQAVVELNTRARVERILDGDTEAGAEVRLSDGTDASAGDLVITRANDRRLAADGGWVRNGDRWRVLAVGHDGSLRVERIDQPRRSRVTLPAAYVSEHVNLGYAVTAHRAQGLTVDSAHVVVGSSTTRENLYVSMTRGRHTNTAYVALDQPDDTHIPPDPDDVSARTVLFGVLQHSGAELSAHQMVEAEQDRWTSIAQLAAEYETIAAVAQHDRWVDLIRRSGLSYEQVVKVIESDSFGPLIAELRRAEADRFDVDVLLPRLVRRRSLDDAEDVGAVLVSRSRHATAQRPRRGSAPDLIAGLLPAARGPMDEDMNTALTERERLIESRSRSLAETAVGRNEPWLAKLGDRPNDPTQGAQWLKAASTVAAYRERWSIEGLSILGHARSDLQRLEAIHASSAIRHARAIAEYARSSPARASGPVTSVGTAPINSASP
ncbi:hypothetical protein AFL01nite_02490 [Aeromicrobium flavum]|uniref:TrwC relaxase domain-containing protein n=1 Tax=Aeromicrobium flavum TaxID=416568 RepID=A0A512HR37_9ACTN|nr:MobF family relaxase [Aeromicrobium flavum]GEO87922.1 hypothetical protein AFL01nite_02490 [Aeromicrobium flavum]